MLQGLKAILTDRAFLNYLLMTFYVLLAVRWAAARSWWDVLYWIGALCITIGVTFR